MTWFEYLYPLLLALSALGSVALVTHFWKARHQPGFYGLLISFTSVSCWASFYIFELLIPAYDIKVWAAKLQFLGITGAPLGIFIFSFYFADRGYSFSSNRLLPLATLPAITILLVFTNEHHGFIWQHIEPNPNPSVVSPLVITHGWFFWIYVVYGYLLMLTSTVLMIRVVRRTQSIYRSQALIFLTALLVPWIGNAVYLSGIFNHVDLTPLMFSVTNVLVTIGLTRSGMFSILPGIYNTIIDSMPNAVIVIDTASYIVEFNQFAWRLLKNPSKTLGKKIQDVMPEASSWLSGIKLDEAMQKEIIISGDPAKPYLLQVAPAHSRDGQIFGQVLIFTDISEQKRSLRQLILQAAAMEAASNSIVITDISGIIQWVNPAFTQLSGYSKDEAVGKSTNLLKSGVHSPEFYHSLWNTILGGRVWQGEVVNKCKDGTLYYEEMSITPVHEDGGGISHFIAIKQDITHRHAAEEALKRAHTEALAASQMKSQLLANVSHELRTPLGTIIGYIEMLEEGYYGELSSVQVNVIQDISASANQLLSFINNLIGQAQVETGKIILRNQLIDPKDLLSIANRIGFSSGRLKDLRIITEMAPGMPGCITGDPFWLGQIIQNLVTNAVKFTEKGYIRITFFQPEPGFWGIRVEDSGIGIEPDAQTTIFEPFHQVDGSITRKQGGSGLGLSIVRDLVSLMKGTIQLQSEVGVGSVFTISLPLLPKD